MVAHTRGLRVGGRRDPNAARRSPPEHWSQSRPSCKSCVKLRARCDGNTPCAQCMIAPAAPCQYIDKKDESEPLSETVDILMQTNSHDHHDANDRVSASETHEARDAGDAERSRKELALWQAANFALAKINHSERQYSGPSNQMPPPALSGTSTSTNHQAAPTAPMSLPLPMDTFRTTRSSLPMNPPAVMQRLSPSYKRFSPQLKPRKAVAYGGGSRPFTRSQRVYPIVSEDDLMVEGTADLKFDLKSALVAMIKQIRSSTIDRNPPVLPPLNLSLYLLNTYRLDVFFMFPFFNLTIFIAAFRSLYEDGAAAPYAFFGLGCSAEAKPQSPMFQCALFMMLSHAAIFSPAAQQQKHFVSRLFWECAMAFISSDLLKADSLASVQTFLIMAVTFNSFGFTGPERRLPAQIAYRLAQHMRLDAGDDGVERCPEEVEVRRQAWYGCVMMTLNCQSPMNSRVPLPFIVTRDPSLADQTPRGSISFDFFKKCIQRCDELEQILKNLAKKRGYIFPEEGSSRSPHMRTELPAMFQRFVAVLSAAPCWNSPGLPPMNVNTLESDTPATVCNARFMFVRSMLFGPILIISSMEDCLASGVELNTVRGMVKDRTYGCAMAALESAVFLLNYMHDRSEPVRWWWDPYHVSTAGLVLVMAQTSDLLWSYAEKNLIKKAWRQCQELLAFGKTNGGFNQDLLRYLWRLNETISDGELKNDCSLAPKPTPSMVTSQSWNLDADGNLTCIDQSSNGMTSDNYMNSDVNPRTTYADFIGLAQRPAAWNPVATVHPATAGANPFHGQPSSSVPAPNMSFYQGQPTFNTAPGLPCSTNPGVATSNATSNATNERDPVLMSALTEILGPAANIWEPWP